MVGKNIISCKAVLKFTVRTIIGLQIYFHWRFWVGIGITAVFSRCTDSLIASSSCSSASHVTAKVLTFIYVSFPSASNNIVSRYNCQILDPQRAQKIYTLNLYVIFYAPSSSVSLTLPPYIVSNNTLNLASYFSCKNAWPPFSWIVVGWRFLVYVKISGRDKKSPNLTSAD